MLLFSGGALSDDARTHILARRPRVIVHGRLFGPDGGSFVVEDKRSTETTQHDWRELWDVVRALEGELGAELDAGFNAGPGRAAAGDDARPRPFAGGWIAACGYDLAWLFEYGLPRYLPPTSPLPDLWLAWYDEALSVDRASGLVRASEQACDELFAATEDDAPSSFSCGGAHCAFHREDYEAAVERVRTHCLDGDLFQADLSRRIEYDFRGSAPALFASLVAASPAPFMGYVGMGGDRAVVSASPEEYLRVRGATMRSRPIKGTRPRGSSGDADDALRHALVTSEKDRAELTMIVDLVRNDLGRVAKPGSVRVSDFPGVLELPQVWHLCADVHAELDEGLDVWDAVTGSFPPGSIVGAPKPMAIEILERVERSRRGMYTGAIGYVEAPQLGGNAHLNVCIRTAEVGDGRLRFGIGGGITALSDAAAEFEETCDKARGFGIALGAVRGLEAES